MIDTTSGSGPSPDGGAEARPRAAGADRPTITIVLPSGWGRAAAAGVGAALVGWFVPVLVASLGFWLVADNPWLQDVTWQSAINLGSSFWALSLGVPAMLGGVAVALVPLLWSLFQVFVLRSLLQALRQYSASAAWAAVPSFALTVLVLDLSSVHVNWSRIVLGGVIVSGIGALWTYLSLARSYPAWMDRMASVWRGIRIGAVWFGVLAALATAAVLTAWWSGHEAVAGASEIVGATGANGVILALLQLAYGPTIVAWGFSWLLGPGFTGVSGAVITPANPPTEALPLPLWQIVPAEVVQLPAWPWPLVALGLVFGVATGWFLRRQPVREAAITLAAAVLSLEAVVAVWMSLSVGALGTNQLARLGPDVGAVALQILVIIVLPAVVIVVGMHPATLQSLVSLAQGARDRVGAGGGTPAPESPDELTSEVEEKPDAE